MLVVAIHLTMVLEYKKQVFKKTWSKTRKTKFKYGKQTETDKNILRKENDNKFFYFTFHFPFSLFFSSFFNFFHTIQLLTTSNSFSGKKKIKG
jgi:hypothetical protein